VLRAGREVGLSAIAMTVSSGGVSSMEGSMV
jgi:hypothetical protein